MDKPQLETMEPEGSGFVQKHGNQWIHVTTFQAAHRILAHGLIAPDKEIKREGVERTWGEQEASWITSRDGHVYVANLQKTSMQKTKQMVDLERKIGTNSYVALNIDMSQIDQSRLAIDEDHISSRDTLDSARAKWFEYVNKELDLKDDPYKNHMDDYTSVHHQGETFEEFAQEFPIEAKIIEIHMENSLGDTEHETLADWAESFHDVDNELLIDYCAGQGSVAVAGHLHPDCLSLHPAEIKRYHAWLDQNPQPELDYAPDYLHPDPHQQTLFERTLDL